jgi:hypothetical protein
MFRKLVLSLAAAAGMVAQLVLPAEAAIGVGAFEAPAALVRRTSAVRLGRPELLLVQFSLARPGLVQVRVRMAARGRLGRWGRLA